MPILSDNPARKSLLLFGLLALLLAGFVLWSGMRRNEQLAELEDIHRRMAWAQSGPLPSNAQTLAALNQSIAVLEERLLLDERDLFREIPGASSTEASGTPTAAFFELAGFIENTYAKLEANGIGFEPDERFGFSQFTRQGPEENILDAVMEQKIVAQYLIDQMVVAKPVRLTEMKREWIARASEPPQTGLRQAAGSQPTQDSSWEDTIAERKDRPGYVGYVFEIGFEGYSDALRKFLNGLVTAPIPILVNALRVEPLDRYAEPDSTVEDAIPYNPFELLRAAKDDPEEENPVPIIQSNLSSFTVTLETILRKRDQIR